MQSNESKSFNGHMFGYDEGVHAGPTFCPNDAVMTGMTFYTNDDGSNIKGIHKIHCNGDQDLTVDWSSFSPIPKTKTLKCPKDQAVKSASVLAKDNSLSYVHLECRDYPYDSKHHNKRQTSTSRATEIGSSANSRDADRDRSGVYYPGNADKYIHGISGYQGTNTLKGIAFHGKSFGGGKTDAMIKKCLKTHDNMYESDQCGQLCDDIIKDNSTCQEQLIKYCKDHTESDRCEQVDDFYAQFCEHNPDNELCTAANENETDDAADRVVRIKEKEDSSNNIIMVILISILIILSLGGFALYLL